MKYLANWLFHYNYHDENWYAFTRENHNKYFNDSDCFCIKSKNISVLMELITRAEGNPDAIEKVIY